MSTVSSSNNFPHMQRRLNKSLPKQMFAVSRCRHFEIFAKISVRNKAYHYGYRAAPYYTHKHAAYNGSDYYECLMSVLYFIYVCMSLGSGVLMFCHKAVLFAESTVRISKRLLRLRVYDRSKQALDDLAVEES